MLEYILFAIGVFLLIKGAEYLVEGSSAFAKRLKVSTLVIGLTVVAFGTSMPELVVNLIASFNGSGDIAFGNIVGSNISNLLLILGIVAIITSIKVQKSTIWKEIPFSLLASIILLIFASTLFLDNFESKFVLRYQGLILLLFFTIFLYYILEMAKKEKAQNKHKALEISKLSNGRMFIYILGGLIGLYLGGKWTVEGAVAFAKIIGMSEYFISLTIVAVGTSLPELITSIIAAKRGDADLAVGNVVGSNIFNIFWVLGLSAVIYPVTIPAFAIYDLIVLLGATLLLFSYMFVGKKHELERWQGIFFVAMYVAYIIYLIFRS